MKSSKAKAVESASYRAFESEFKATWGATKFKGELESLCYFRSLTCWLTSTPDDLCARRELLYRYAEPHFDTDNITSTLNELYQALPVKSGAKRIMRNLCGLYNKAARRSFGTDDKKNTIYARGEVDTALKTAHRLARLTNNCIIIPAIREGQMELEVLPPDLYRVVLNEDNFRKIEELWIPVKRRGGKTLFNVWTKDNYTQRDIEGKILQQIPNKYGRIPAVFVQLEKDSTDYYGGGMVELVEAELDNNFLKFLIDNNVVYSAFNVWIATNFGQTNFTLAPNKVIAINDVAQGEGFLNVPSLQNITGSESFGLVEDLQTRRYQNALREMGLPAIIYSPDAKAESGYALYMQRQELMEIRQEDEPIFRRIEMELYELLSAMYALDLSITMPSVQEFNVDYQEQGIQLEPTEDYTLKTQKFNDGLLSALDYVREISGIDTLSTNEEAIDYIRKNKELVSTISNQPTISDAQAISDNTIPV